MKKETYYFCMRAAMKQLFDSKVLTLLSLVICACAAPEILAQETASEVEDDVINLEEFIVEGFSDGLTKSMIQQREARNFKDVLNADSVGKLPDSNAAEALARLPGLYLDSSQSDQGEGRYVSIRGVDPTLNIVTMNGQNIASSDTGGRRGRATPLDVETVANANPGQILGYEFTYQQEFDFLPAPFDGLGIVANFTWIDSEVGVFQRTDDIPFFPSGR